MIAGGILAGCASVGVYILNWLLPIGDFIHKVWDFVSSPITPSHWLHNLSEHTFWLGSAGTLTILIPAVYYATQFAVGRANLQAAKRKLTLEFLNEWRQPEFNKSRQHVLRTVLRKCKEGGESFVEKGYAGLTEADKLHVIRVSYFCDYLGNMIALKAVEEKLLLTILCRPIIDHWHVLRPLIEAERRNRLASASHDAAAGKTGDNYLEKYQAGFEHLYDSASNFKQKGALDLKSDPVMAGKPPIPELRSWD